jgi:hypothetical protein
LIENNTPLLPVHQVNFSAPLKVESSQMEEISEVPPIIKSVSLQRNHILWGKYMKFYERF